MKKKVVGLGEVLWDLLPRGASLGGAPANFAYIANLMGDRGIVASCVGEDSRGLHALRRMRELGLDIDHMQTDREHPTGTVKVEVGPHGQPRFEIAREAAWDHLQWTPDWQHLAETADAICFGSLAQRSLESRATIRQFLVSASPRAVKVFDVNLRQTYYSEEVIAESMKLAGIVKVNDDELPTILSLSRIAHDDELSSAQKLIRAYDLEIVCITRGSKGSLLVRADEASEHIGFKVHVADTVGAGDAFTAGLVHEHLKGASLARMNEVANRVGAWVAGEIGAMPIPAKGTIEHSLAEIG